MPLKVCFSDGDQMREHTAKLGAIDCVRAALFRNIGGDSAVVFLTHKVYHLIHVAAIDGLDPTKVPHAAEIVLHPLTPGHAPLHVNIIHGERQHVVQVATECRLTGLHEVVQGRIHWISCVAVIGLSKQEETSGRGGEYTVLTLKMAQQNPSSLIEGRG